MVYRKRNRVTMVLVYLAYVLSAMMFLFIPESGTTALSDQTSLVHVWHGFLALGSLTGLIAVLRRSVVVEMIAIPLINTALLAYAAILFAHGITPTLVGVRLAILFIFIGNVILLIRRWIDLEDRVHIEVDMRNREKSISEVLNERSG